MKKALDAYEARQREKTKEQKEILELEKGNVIIRLGNFFGGGDRVPVRRTTLHRILDSQMDDFGPLLVIAEEHDARMDTLTKEVATHKAEIATLKTEAETTKKEFDARLAALEANFGVRKDGLPPIGVSPVSVPSEQDVTREARKSRHARMHSRTANYDSGVESDASVSTIARSQSDIKAEFPDVEMRRKPSTTIADMRASIDKRQLRGLACNRSSVCWD